MSIFNSNLPALDIPVMPAPDYVLSACSKHGDLVALVDGPSGRKYTHGQLEPLVNRLAHGLHAAGVRFGDVLCINSPNVPEYAIAFHGALRLGVTLTTCSPLFTADEIARQLKDSGAKFVLTVSVLAGKTAEAAASVGGIEKMWSFDDADGFLQFKALLAADGDFPRPEFDPKTHPAIIPYSSGTTGLPKGVVLSHYNLLANVMQVMAVEHDLSPKDTFMGVLPFYHIYGMVLILNISLVAGGKTVVMPRFDMVQFLELAQEHKATYLHVVPPIVVGLAKHPVVAKYDLSSVRYVFSGAAPLSESVEAAIKARLNCGIKQGYGMTEMSPASHVTPYPADADGDVPAGTCGVLLPNLEAKIVDPESGALQGVGAEGELWVRGPNVMLRYHNREDATAHTIDADGFLHTGDVAKVDARGFYFITDRIKELIKTNGRQVAPAELEGILLRHPAVMDVAVIGKPDESAGEFPMAFVVLKPGAEASEDDIFKHVADNAAPYKKLKGGVRFVDAIPKSLSGKILRRVLKAQVLEEMKKST